MGHRHDWVEHVRRAFIPRLGRLVAEANHTFGTDYYVTGRTAHNQYACTVDMGEEAFEEVLHDLGYERNPLAAWKRLTLLAKSALGAGVEYEEGSWRLTRGDRQIHVILFDGVVDNDASDGWIRVYAHDEYRWDCHPWKHYRAVDFSAVAGVEAVRDQLTVAGVPYRLEPAIVDKR